MRPPHSGASTYPRGISGWSTACDAGGTMVCVELPPFTHPTKAAAAISSIWRRRMACSSVRWGSPGSPFREAERRLVPVPVMRTEEADPCPHVARCGRDDRHAGGRARAIQVANHQRLSPPWVADQIRSVAIEEERPSRLRFHRVRVQHPWRRQPDCRIAIATVVENHRVHGSQAMPLDGEPLASGRERAVVDEVLDRIHGWIGAYLAAQALQVDERVLFVLPEVP